MQIRPAEISDLPRILEIEQESFPKDPWTASMFEEELYNPMKYFIVAEDGGRVLGFADTFLLPEICAEVFDIAVAGEARRRGIGKALMENIIDKTADCGVDCLQLEVRTGNDPAIALYRSLGFEDAGIRKDYYGEGEDAILMDLIL